MAACMPVFGCMCRAADLMWLHFFSVKTGNKEVNVGAEVTISTENGTLSPTLSNEFLIPSLSLFFLS